MMATQLEVLLGQFSTADIEVLPLKGPVLAETLYGGATMRWCCDLDLLVRGDDYRKAEDFLFGLGYVASPEVEDYHRKFLRNGVSVELHFDLALRRYFPFDLDGIWSRSRRGYFRGRPMRMMSDQDLILFLCLHGLKHGFSRLIWIMDIARAVNGVTSGGCEELMRRARKQGMEPWLLIGCEVIRKVLPQQLPQAMDLAIAQSPDLSGRARQIVDRLIEEGPEVVKGHRIRTLYLQLERNPLNRWYCRLSNFMPTVEDYRWADRHSISRNLIPFLRPIRVLRKCGPSKIWQTLFPSTTKTLQITAEDSLSREDSLIAP